VIGKGSWGRLRVGDLDGDGRRELVAASKDGRGLGLWRWDGSEFSVLNGWLPDRGIYFDVDLGDVRSNGELAVAAVRADGGVEVWSKTGARPLPLRQFAGRPIGKPLRLYFDTASSNAGMDNEQTLGAWLTQLGSDYKKMHFRIFGRADVRPIHNEVFPSNKALSRARAESVAAILRQHGIPEGRITMEALGDTSPMPAGLSSEALQQNRRVLVQAYPLQSVRLPPVAGKPRHEDLYHVKENRVFKTLGGIPEYRVGPGDELSVTLWQGGKPVENKVVVQIDGTISLPFFEALRVAGMTPREIDTFITKSFSRFVRHPRVDVRVLKAQSKAATILGKVQGLARGSTGPGTYFLRGRETVVDFLSRAGGPTRDADLSRVQISRRGKTMLLNLDRAIMQGDWSENAIVDDGDTIFIPSLAQSKRRVYVLGEVKKPGIVEFSGDIHFLDAVSKSGGFKDEAYLRDIRVVRSDRDQPQIYAVAFDRLMKRGDLTQNMALRDKDIIIVPAEPIANWNRFLKKLMPTINTALVGVTTVEDALVVRDLLRGTGNVGTTTAVPVGGP